MEPKPQAVAFPCKHTNPAGHTICAVVSAGHTYPLEHFCTIDDTEQ